MLKRNKNIQKKNFESSRGGFVAMGQVGACPRPHHLALSTFCLSLLPLSTSRLYCLVFLSEYLVEVSRSIHS